MAEQGSSRDEDDDWEGVESTELDEAFSAATLFVTTAASDRLSQKVPSEVQQQLYGLYKIATEGPCTAPQPSALKITARAKWYLSLVESTVLISLRRNCIIERTFLMMWF